MGGGGGAEGLGWDLPIGCQDKFQHIVKKKKKPHWLFAHCVPMFIFAMSFSLLP